MMVRRYLLEIHRAFTIHRVEFTIQRVALEVAGFSQCGGGKRHAKA
jgi:hypothetical protein